MLKGEPVNESELLQNPSLIPNAENNPKIIEAENPDIFNGINPQSDDINLSEVPKYNMINNIRFPGNSVLNPNNSNMSPQINNNNNINNNFLPSSNPENNIPEDQKIPYIHGEKTIICWNCVSVLMVKEEWSVVRCTNCGKINRVPGTEDNIDGAIRLNDNMNHFDLYVPYVYAVITCPFCQAENKVRKDAEHVICFNCQNSYNIQHEPWENMVANMNANNNKSYPIVQQPTVVNTCDNSGNAETQRLLKKLIDILKEKEKQPKKIIFPNFYDSYKPIRNLVRNVDDIDDVRFNAIGQKNGIFGVMGNRINTPVIDRGISDVTKKIAGININLNKGDNNLLIGNKDIEMEKLKKKLYAEIQNDPKYKDAYGYRNLNGNKKYGMSRPLSFVADKSKNNYYSDKPKNDAVYKLMFKNKEDLKQSYDISKDKKDGEEIIIKKNKDFDTSKLPIGKTLKTKEEVNEILKNLNIDFQI